MNILLSGLSETNKEESYDSKWKALCTLYSIKCDSPVKEAAVKNISIKLFDLLRLAVRAHRIVKSDLTANGTPTSTTTSAPPGSTPNNDINGLTSQMQQAEQQLQQAGSTPPDQLNSQLQQLKQNLDNHLQGQGLSVTGASWVKLHERSVTASLKGKSIASTKEMRLRSDAILAFKYAGLDKISESLLSNPVSLLDTNIDLNPIKKFPNKAACIEALSIFSNWQKQAKLVLSNNVEEMEWQGELTCNTPNGILRLECAPYNYTIFYESTDGRSKQIAVESSLIGVIKKLMSRGINSDVKKFRTNTATVFYEGDALTYLVNESNKKIVPVSIGPSPGIAVVMFNDKGLLESLSAKYNVKVEWSSMKVEYLPTVFMRQTGFSP